jgi:hypothetical protein
MNNNNKGEERKAKVISENDSLIGRKLIVYKSRS